MVPSLDAEKRKRESAESVSWRTHLECPANGWSSSRSGLQRRERKASCAYSELHGITHLRTRLSRSASGRSSLASDPPALKTNLRSRARAPSGKRAMAETCAGRGERPVGLVRVRLEVWGLGERAGEGGRGSDLCRMLLQSVEARAVEHGPNAQRSVVRAAEEQL